MCVWRIENVRAFLCVLTLDNWRDYTATKEKRKRKLGFAWSGEQLLVSQCRRKQTRWSVKANRIMRFKYVLEWLLQGRIKFAMNKLCDCFSIVGTKLGNSLEMGQFVDYWIKSIGINALILICLMLSKFLLFMQTIHFNCPLFFTNTLYLFVSISMNWPNTIRAWYPSTKETIERWVEVCNCNCEVQN